MVFELKRDKRLHGRFFQQLHGVYLFTGNGKVQIKVQAFLRLPIDFPFDS